MSLARRSRLDSARPERGARPERPSYSDEDSDDSGELDEVIEAIMASYKATFNPELRIKFKRRLKDVTLCACYSKPHQLVPRWRLTMKPTGEGGPFSRFVGKLLVVPHNQQAALYSRKLEVSVFRLQFVMGYNWGTRTPSLDYQLGTKWGDGPRLKRKESFQLSPSCLLRAKWDVDLHIPEMHGHFGGDSQDHPRAVDVDYGAMHFQISQLDCVLEL